MNINICVVSANPTHNTVIFTVSCDLTFHKLFKMYNDRYNKIHTFYYNDVVIDGNKNSIDLKIKNGDTIYAKLVEENEEMVVDTDILGTLNKGDIEIKPIDEYVNIVVKSFDGVFEEVLLVEKSTQLIYCLQKYVEKYEYYKICFYFAGNLIVVTDTPDVLGMKDGDVINIVIV